jgi:hypothetical protein
MVSENRTLYLTIGDDRIMSNDSHVPDLIPYNEMYRIIREKFNITHDELRYWIKISLEFIKSNEIIDCGDTIIPIDDCFNNGLYLLFPYVSDLPTFNNYYDIPPDGFFYPEYCFYDKQTILQFKPSYHLRFVYKKDLTGKRNWNDYRVGIKDSSLSKILLKAYEHGILRFYDHIIDEFTKFGSKSQLWCHSFDVESYVENPESFFLLYDILNVERIFLGKDRESCLNELGIKPIDLPTNVINLKNKKGLK